MIPIKYITDKSPDSEVNGFLRDLCGVEIDYMSSSAIPILSGIISEMGDNQKLVVGESILYMVGRDRMKWSNCGAPERARAIAMLYADKGWSDEQVEKFRERHVKPYLNSD